jgi:hypothetical protein
LISGVAVIPVTVMPSALGQCGGTSDRKAGRWIA